MNLPLLSRARDSLPWAARNTARGNFTPPTEEEFTCEEMLPEFLVKEGTLRMKAPMIAYKTFDGKTSYYKMELEYNNDMTWSIKSISAVDK